MAGQRTPKLNFLSVFCLTKWSRSLRLIVDGSGIQGPLIRDEGVHFQKCQCFLSQILHVGRPSTGRLPCLGFGQEHGRLGGRAIHSLCPHLLFSLCEKFSRLTSESVPGERLDECTSSHKSEVMIKFALAGCKRSGNHRECVSRVCLWKFAQAGSRLKGVSGLRLDFKRAVVCSRLKVCRFCSVSRSKSVSGTRLRQNTLA